MFGASARIGEVLAIRRRDIVLITAPTTMRIAGTIIGRNGESTFRRDHPKSTRSRRVVALPTFTAAAVRADWASIDGLGPEELLFNSRQGTPRTTVDVRRLLRTVLERAGISGATQHMFCRTVATTVHDSASLELAAELLGHTYTEITV